MALKVIRPERLGTAEVVERFLFEARITARFSHPHIITVYAVGEYQGYPYLALEYLKGESLRNRMRNAGAVGQSLWTRALVSHFWWSRPHGRGREYPSDALYEEGRTRVRARSGLSQHLPEAKAAVEGGWCI